MSPLLVIVFLIYAVFLPENGHLHMFMATTPFERIQDHLLPSKGGPGAVTDSPPKEPTELFREGFAHYCDKEKSVGGKIFNLSSSSFISWILWHRDCSDISS